MPVHLAAHIAAGHHIPGIITLNPELTMGETIEQLLLISEASIAAELRDVISYLPVA